MCVCVCKFTKKSKEPINHNQKKKQKHAGCLEGTSHPGGRESHLGFGQAYIEDDQVSSIRWEEQTNTTWKGGVKAVQTRTDKMAEGHHNIDIDQKQKKAENRALGYTTRNNFRF